MKSILIVEDDITFGMMLKTWLEKKGFEVSTESSVAHAYKRLSSKKFDMVLTDLRLPDGDGILLLKRMKEKGIHIPLIVMTGYADIQTAVMAIKLGAGDYIAKPVNPDELLKKINETFAHKKEPEPATPQPSSRYAHLEGESDAARQLYNYVGLVAPTNMSVLITGASGTGKEYVAKRIHELSNRREKPFVPIDCGSIPKDLAASEFFGHVKGSFTGALSDKTGAFIAANGGTIFLDEVGNLSYEVQVQLLRALQERRIRPVGSNKETEVNVRVISATNEDLQSAIRKNTFREDLYHRLNEFTLHVPDLKNRCEDVLLFANFFLDQANRELGKQIAGFDEGASAAIREYRWPGNLRELKNVVKRATLLAQDKYISREGLGIQPTSGFQESMALRNEELEKNQILEALKQAGYNKSKAAQLLSIDRKTLYNKIKQHGLEL